MLQMTTPVRVLKDQIVAQFENINDDVRQLHESLRGKVNPQICVDTNLQNFSGPSFDTDTNSIKVSESFLNVLWALTFFCFVYQEKSNETLKQSPQATAMCITGNSLVSAFSLLNWAVRVSQSGYLNWPLNCVDPSLTTTTDAETREFASKTNGIFLTAIAFLFVHELGHIHGHEDVARMRARMMSRLQGDPQYDPPPGDMATIKEAETEADNFAMDLLIRGDEDRQTQLNVFVGMLSAYLSILFLLRSPYSIRQPFHPDVHERIRRCLLRLDQYDIVESDYLYHMASQLLTVFLSQHQVRLKSYDAGTDLRGYFEQVLDRIDEFVDGGAL